MKAWSSNYSSHNINNCLAERLRWLIVSREGGGENIFVPSSGRLISVIDPSLVRDYCHCVNHHSLHRSTHPSFHCRLLSLFTQHSLQSSHVLTPGPDSTLTPLPVCPGCRARSLVIMGPARPGGQRPGPLVFIFIWAEKLGHSQGGCGITNLPFSSTCISQGIVSIGLHTKHPGSHVNYDSSVFGYDQLSADTTIVSKLDTRSCTILGHSDISHWGGGVLSASEDTQWARQRLRLASYFTF